MPDSASGRVDDAVLAEVLLQAVGDAEDAAELADVLTHEQDLVVGLHGLAQAHVEALGESDLLGAHQWAPLERSCEVGREAVALLADLVGHLAEDVAELVHRLRVGQRLAPLAEVVAQLLGLGVEVVEELLVDQAVAAQVDLEPLDRVLELPVLELVVEAVARRVVGRGVRTHPVGVGLDERRAVAVAGALQRGLRDGVRRQHVVAVDADAREAEAQRALVERDAGLALDRLGDGPLVVLAEEHDGGVVGRGEDERLVDVALRGRAVTEVGEHGRVALGVAGADDAVALHAHGVAGGVERLGADDDRVETEVVLVGVPAALVDAAEQAEQPQRVDALAVGDAVLAVGREGVVLGTHGAAGADLRGLLAEQLGPDAELAVALERGGLDVDASGQHHVAVETAQLLGGEVVVELGVVDALTLGRQQLDEVGATVGLGGPEDLRQVGAETHRIGQRSSPSTASGSHGIAGRRRLAAWSSACVTPTT